MAWSSSPWADPSSPLRGGGGPWAHESWPADEVLFNLRVPSPGPSRRERLFPERPDFPTGTKCGLFAGMNLGVGQPGQAWRCPAAARRYHSGTFRLPHSWG